MLPNFIIAGAPRCGTTSLFYYLKQHPDVAFPKLKEPRYFSSLNIILPQRGPGDITVDDKLVLSFTAYKNLYSDINRVKRIGDASSAYLYHSDVSADAIKEELGDIPIIIMLRNPIERTYSAYNNLVRDGREDKTFEHSLELEDKRINENWDMMWAYKNVSLYSKQVKKYKEIFSKVKIIIFEEFAEKPKEVLGEVLNFLDLEGKIEFDTSQKYSHSGKPKNKIIELFTSRNNRFMGFLRKKIMDIIPRKYLESIASKMLKKEDIDPKVRHELNLFFKDDIKALENLIQKDLSFWK